MSTSSAPIIRPARPEDVVRPHILAARCRAEAAAAGRHIAAHYRSGASNAWGAAKYRYSRVVSGGQATYEKEPESVKATPELVRARMSSDFINELHTTQLRKNLFGETPYAHALLAFLAPDAPKPVGLALYFFNYSTWTGRPGLYVCRCPTLLSCGRD